MAAKPEGILQDGNYLGVILGAIFLQTLTNLLMALGWGDAGKWLGFGIVLFILQIVYVSNRRSRWGFFIVGSFLAARW